MTGPERRARVPFCWRRRPTPHPTPPSGSTTRGCAWCAWPPCWPGCGPRCRPRSTRSASSSCSSTWSARWCGCSPAWRSWASRSTARCCGRSAVELTAECAVPRGHHARTGRGRRSTSTRSSSCAPCSTSDLGLHPGPEDQDRLLDRRPDARVAAGPAPHHRGPAPLPRGREAAVDLRRVPGRRGGGRRPDPRHLPPDGGPDGSPVVGPSQPPQHPGADRRGPSVPRGVRPLGGPTPAGRRLRPGRAAGHRPPVGRPGTHRRLRGGRGHPPHRGRPGVRGRARRGHPRTAVDGQDGLLRPGLRHGGLRPGPAPGRPGGGGQGDPRRLLRRRSPRSTTTWTGPWPRPGPTGTR